MTKNKNSAATTVQKTTLYGAVLVALAVGFFAGVIFSVYHSSSPAPQTAAVPQPQAPADNQSRQLDALIKETAQNPQNVSAWTDLGNLYFDTNQFEKAIWAYKKSLELKPDNPNVWTDLGVMYRRNGQPEDAVKSFDEAIRIDPKHEVSRFNKGIVLLHDLDKPKEGIRSWEALLKINPFAEAPGGKSVDELVTIYKRNLEQIN
jgi:cytochrome c-type biogenesis protein CcmH/NrfG